jgi:hypothetical protein
MRPASRLVGDSGREMEIDRAFPQQQREQRFVAMRAPAPPGAGALGEEQRAERQHQEGIEVKREDRARDKGPLARTKVTASAPVNGSTIRMIIDFAFSTTARSNAGAQSSSVVRNSARRPATLPPGDPAPILLVEMRLQAGPDDARIRQRMGGEEQHGPRTGVLGGGRGPERCAGGAEVAACRCQSPTGSSPSPARTAPSCSRCQSPGSLGQPSM